MSLPTEHTQHGKDSTWVDGGMNMKFFDFFIYDYNNDSKTMFALRQAENQAIRQAGRLTDSLQAKARLTCRQMKKARCAHRQNCRHES